MWRRQLTYLNIWINHQKRKPLIIRGARQVGKSTLVREFCAAENLKLHEINLEQHRDLKAALASNNGMRILQEFQLIVNHGNINILGSLLFIDEIQAIPQALEALRYIQEAAPSLPIIAAGSLLEFTLSDHDYSMPVGRIEYLFMGPLTFEEFVQAAGEVSLLNYLRTYRLSDGVFSNIAHDKLIEFYRIFCTVGGMPEAADVFFQTHDFSASRRAQGSVVTTYRDDFAKYAKGADLIRLQKMLDHVTICLGEKVKYSKVDPDVRSTDLKKALFLLHRAQVIELAYHSSGSIVPLRAQADLNIFKPYYLDCGLISYTLGSSTSMAQTKQMAHEGKLAEQFIAQHLLTFGDTMLRQDLYYWLREGRHSNAEVDFLFAIDGNIFPIEVKSGKAGSLKSLHQFVATKRSKLAIRFSQSPPELSPVTYTLTNNSNKGTFRLLSLPFYLVGQLERLVIEAV
jgi:predicted AAA+ superfamily ATPase